MNTPAETGVIPHRPIPSPSRTFIIFLWALVAVGSLAFLVGILGMSPQRAWQAYLVNWLFWSGLSLSGLTLAAILHVTKATWAGPLRRLAEGTAAFLPVSFVLFFLLFLGQASLFPWIHEPVAAKQAWLTVPFLFLRDTCSLTFLYALGLAFLYYSLRPDMGGRVYEQDASRAVGLAGRLCRNWRGAAMEQAHSSQVLAVLSPLFIFFYAVFFSLITFDLVMSLEPEWISTLFGAYFCIGNLYIGLAVLAIVAAVSRHHLGLQTILTPDQFHDLGKLIFGFCILWTYLFWSQYLPIWYGNIPEETGFVLLRTREQPWMTVSWTVLALNFLIPFPILLSQQIKRVPIALAAVCVVIVVGMWLERYILVVPSLWREATLPLGLIELCILAGFFAGYTLAFLAFMQEFFPVFSPAVSLVQHKTRPMNENTEDPLDEEHWTQS